jgi:toxin FitB
MYLVDTNGLSEGEPSRTRASAELVAWMERRSDDLFLSSMTIVEVADGAARLAGLGAHAKARRIEAWIKTILHLYSARILPLDAGVAQVCGRLSAASRAGGRSPGLADLIIAATATFHGLTVLTRNVRDFASLGVQVVNPFEELPKG